MKFNAFVSNLAGRAIGIDNDDGSSYYDISFNVFYLNEGLKSGTQTKPKPTNSLHHFRIRQTVSFRIRIRIRIRLSAPFICKTELFTKTGSGQT